MFVEIRTHQTPACAAAAPEELLWIYAQRGFLAPQQRGRHGDVLSKGLSAPVCKVGNICEQ